MKNSMNYLFEQGLIREEPNGNWSAVNTMEEKENLLNQRKEEAQRVKNLEEQVNQRAPPEIGSDR